MLKALVAFIGDPGVQFLEPTPGVTQFSVTPAPEDLKPLTSVGIVLVYLPAHKHIIQLYKHIIKNKSSKIGKNTVCGGAYL